MCRYLTATTIFVGFLLALISLLQATRPLSEMYEFTPTLLRSQRGHTSTFEYDDDYDVYLLWHSTSPFIILPTEPAGPIEVRICSRDLWTVLCRTAWPMRCVLTLFTQVAVTPNRHFEERLHVLSIPSSQHHSNHF